MLLDWPFINVRLMNAKVLMPKESDVDNELTIRDQKPSFNGP